MPVPTKASALFVIAFENHYIPFTARTPRRGVPLCPHTASPRHLSWATLSCDTYFVTAP